MKKTLIFALALSGLAASGCFSRAHLTKSHGRAYHQAFERQAVNPPGSASAKTPKGLDAMEAGIVVDTYRAQLAPKAQGSASDQMIILSPNSGSLGYAPPVAPPAK
jgi:hypothetical protein